MTRNLLRWVAPLVLTFAGGTIVAHAMSLSPADSGVKGQGGVVREGTSEAFVSRLWPSASLEAPIVRSAAQRNGIQTTYLPNVQHQSAGLSRYFGTVSRLHVSQISELPQAAPSAPYAWSATRDATGAIVVSGDVPARATQQYFSVRFPSNAEDLTEIRSGAPMGFSQSVLQALDILALLSEGDIQFDGNRWTVVGIAATPTTIDEVASLLASEGPAWTVQIAAPGDEKIAAPTADPQHGQEPAAAVTAGSAATPAANSAALAQCRDRVAELTAHNAILFQSGSAIIAESATSELDAFASALAGCADTMVYVEGHTDSDGDAQKNLALSVARAESVVNALIDRGVAPERLYAIGYGESRPVADNATSDGKRQNRRIIVSVDTDRQ